MLDSRLDHGCAVVQTHDEVIHNGGPAGRPDRIDLAYSARFPDLRLAQAPKSLCRQKSLIIRGLEKLPVAI